ncbi:fumarylacetoacetate hydrolase family protein [Paludibacterium yongneupense]|uniref:fumarylacetoacetate hydrolase family protein n=1 Tax=Paludibacterium yongneupense TaxID=400061 RepID=UPI00040C0CC0|nr:fumarylacetoacetate hydrolase family protein [Paludibacterium yongneupense]
MTHVRIAGRDTRVSSIYCIGRNYAAHAAEMGSRVEAHPMVFLKPVTALLAPGKASLPSFSSDVHHEAELVVLIGKGGVDIPASSALEHVAGYGIGVDLTARDVQAELKKKGHPWALAKGFRGSAWLSEMVPAASVSDLAALEFNLDVNGVRRQHGVVRDMVFPVPELIAYISSVYGLADGDLIYSGTPEGVGALHLGDRVDLELAGLVSASWSIE